MKETAILILLRSFIFTLGLLPNWLRIRVLYFLIKNITRLTPKYRKVSMINLALAFPECRSDWYSEILDKNFYHLAVALSDFIRMPNINQTWIKEHIEFPYLERYEYLKKSEPEKGIIVASGHLGSFELMAYAVSVLGYPISFIVRNFKMVKLDRWWNSVRERHGNKVISRRGAYREMIRSINSGRDVGILFDQNVTQRHAIFVDWFGRKAATTKSLALAALETEARVLVASLQYIGKDRYRMNVVECDLADIYEDKSLSRIQKVKTITEITSNCYQEMIKNYPEGWFWMHRRWKTVDRESGLGDLYKN